MLNQYASTRLAGGFVVVEREAAALGVPAKAIAAPANMTAASSLFLKVAPSSNPHFVVFS
jgi:hypothetical protein